MIVIGLGANLESPRHGGPQQTLEAALRRLPAFGVQVLRRSRWYRSPPMVDDELRRQADVFLELTELMPKIAREPGRRHRAQEERRAPALEEDYGDYDEYEDEYQDDELQGA